MKDFKALRQEKGLTQGNIAEAFGIRTSTVSMWETGDSLPRADKLYRLAEIFGCTVDDLLEALKKRRESA